MACARFIRLLAVTFTAEDGGLSLENLTMVFSNSYDRLALMNSIWLAIAVAVTGTALGFCFAFAVVRIKMPAPVRWFIAAVTVLPLISPPFTSSIALTLSLGPNGILLNLLGIPDFNIYGFWGTWMSESLTYFPVAFLTISSVLACIDPNFEDAGLSLGGSPFRVFRTVTLPLTIGNHGYGRYRWTILSHKTKAEHYDGHGNIISATLSISLQEYLR